MRGGSANRGGGPGGPAGPATPDGGSPQAPGDADDPTEPSARKAASDANGVPTLIAESVNEDSRAIGSMIGHYVIKSVVGSGGMGVVYAAHDPKLKRKVAIKVLHRHAHSRDPRRGARLIREARAMAKLSHPNVITVYDADTQDGEIYLAMEFVQGRTLGDWVREHRGWREIVKTFIGAGRGLEAAHAVGLIHRDFKPDNVLIDAAGRARVTDFGIARSNNDDNADHSQPVIMPRARDLNLTRAGELVGTPRYMSPEQFVDEPVDPRSDQFSFCVVLYEALYGDHPFAASTMTEQVLRVSRGERAPLPKDVSVPRWLRGVLDRGLSVNPNDRFPSMGALLHELERTRADWRKISVAGACAAALAFGGWKLASRSHHADDTGARCASAGTELAKLWSPARKAELERAFKATKVGFAEQAWQTTSRLIDAYVLQIRSLQDDSCRAHDELNEERWLCVSYQRRSLGALLELFAKADGTVIEHAVDAAQALPDLRVCTSSRALTPAVPLPKDPTAKANVDEARELTSLAELNLASGRFDDGLRLSTKAVAAARAGGYAPVLAQSLIIAGRLHWQKAQLDEARESFRDAAATAELARDDLAKGRALLWLVEVFGVELNDFRAGDMFAQLARASLDRAGEGNGLVAAQLDYHVGMMQLRHADTKEGLASELEALHIREAALGPLHGDVGSTLVMIGIAMHELGRFDESLDYERRALKIIEATYGAGHPMAANALNELANVFVAKGDLAQAISTYEEAIHRLEASVGRKHPDIAIFLSNLGTALLARDDAPPATIRTAIGHFREALAIEREVLGPSTRSVADTLQNLGRAELRLLDGRAALESLGEALAIFKQHPQPPPDLGAILFDLAKAASLVKRKAEARSYARAAIEQYEATERSAEAQGVREWAAALR